MNIKKKRTLRPLVLLAVALAALLAVGAVALGGDGSDAAPQNVTVNIDDANNTGVVQYSVDGGSTWANFGTGPLSFEAGSQVRLKAISTTDDLFLWWTGGVKAVGDEYTLTVPSSPTTVTAKFVDASVTYWTTLSTLESGNGEIQFDLDGTWIDAPAELKYPIDADITIKAHEVGGSKFIAWTGDLMGAEPEVTLRMSGSKFVRAEFYTGTTYELTAVTVIHTSISGTPQGSIQYDQTGYGDWQDFPVSGKINVPAGASVELKANITGGVLLGTWSSSPASSVVGNNERQTLSNISAATTVTIELGMGPNTAVTLSVTDWRGDPYSNGSVQYSLNGGEWDTWESSYDGASMWTGGDTLLIRPNPSSTGTFVWWTGNVSSTVPQQTVPTNVGLSIAYTAVFADSTLNIASTIAQPYTTGPGGKIQYLQGLWGDFPLGGVLTVPSDIGSIGIRAVADPGSVFLWWTGELTGPANNQTLVVNGSKSITANFNRNSPGDNRTVIAGVEGSGSISIRNTGIWGDAWQDLPASGQMVIPNHYLTNTMEFRATADGGSRFVWWTGGLSGPGAVKTLTVDGNKALTAVFGTEANTVQITTTATGGGSVQFLLDGAYVDAVSGMYVPRNSTLNFKAVPLGVNEFAWWTGSLTGTDADAALLADGPKTVNAVFASTLYLVTGSTTDGSIQYSVDGGATFLALPVAGLSSPAGFSLILKLVGNSTPLNTWTVNGADAAAGNSNPLTLVVDEPKTIGTDFTMVLHLITVTVGPHGASDPGSSFYVEHGETATFRFAPEKGYEVSEILLDGESVLGELRLLKYILRNITADHEVEISFDQRTYTITAYADDGAVITPAGSIGVVYLGQAAFTFSAKPGQVIQAIVIDGEVRQDLDGAESYVFRAIDANHTIDILTTDKILTLTVEIVGGTGDSEYKIGGGGYLRYNGRVVIPYGADITVRVAPDDGLEVLRWWAGTVIGVGDTIHVNDADDPVHLVAVVGKPPINPAAPLDIPSEWIVAAVLAVLAALLLAVGVSKLVKARKV